MFNQENSFIPSKSFLIAGAALSLFAYITNNHEAFNKGIILGPRVAPFYLLTIGLIHIGKKVVTLTYNKNPLLFQQASAISLVWLFSKYSSGSLDINNISHSSNYIFNSLSSISKTDIVFYGTLIGTMHSVTQPIREGIYRFFNPPAPMHQPVPHPPPVIIPAN